jgi:hypothetical protein
MGPEDLAVTLAEDGRGVQFQFERGDLQRAFELTFPVVLDRGVYKSESAYAKGDGVSFGGSFFIAQRDTSERPETSDAWRLAVKRGRDGRDGVLKPVKDLAPLRVPSAATGEPDGA